MFDIESAAELFAMLRHRFEDYSTDDEKSTEDAIFIVLIANHLREWIAPNYGPSKNIWPPATTDAERFSRRVFENSNFSVVRKLANGTKHLRQGPKTDTLYFGEAATGDIPRNMQIGLIAGQPVLKGLPAAHFVDDQLLEDVIGPVIDLYAEWFEPAKGPN